MGYDLHITLKNHHADLDGPEITSSEWLQVIDNDPSLRLAGYNGEFFTLWDGPSEHEEPWFDLFYGNIYSKNPDPAIILKMLEIAQLLGALVQGDDGEVYTSPTEYHFPEQPEPAAPEKVERKGWRRLLPW